MAMEIQGLRCLDGAGLEWELRCGAFDFHIRHEPETGTWLLEQFRSSVRDADSAHADEAECDSLQDALLFALEASRPRPPHR